MSNKGIRYSTEFKIRAVELSKSRGNISSVSSELNVTYESLQRWRKAYESGKLIESSSKYSPEQEEIIQLRRLLRDITEERDILKKAVSIFSERKDK